MCGRFVQAQSAQSYADHFGAAVSLDEAVDPSWNVAPTDRVYAVADHEGNRLLGAFRWGLIPWFAKEAKVGARHINARAFFDDGRMARWVGGYDSNLRLYFREALCEISVCWHVGKEIARLLEILCIGINESRKFRLWIRDEHTRVCARLRAFAIRFQQYSYLSAPDDNSFIHAPT